MSAHLHKVSHFLTCPLLLFLLQNLCLAHVLVDQMKGYSTLHQFIECEASWGTRRNSNDIVEVGASRRINRKRARVEIFPNRICTHCTLVGEAKNVLRLAEA